MPHTGRGDEGHSTHASERDMMHITRCVGTMKHSGRESRRVSVTPLGGLHTTLAVVALVTGAVVLLRRKGGASHRRIGWTYAVSMFGVNLTAFGLYELFGGFGPFHAAALLSLVTVIMGVIPAWRRRPRGEWIVRHYYWMTWSYVGLLAATASEAITRLADTFFWWMVLLATAGVAAIGAALINRKAASTIAEGREATVTPLAAVD